MTPSEVDDPQALAADPSLSAFVTANAGSGKTKVLIDRIARLLLAGSPPASFLCITFTKAAAGEMQRRLYQRLGTWCVSDDAELRKELIELVGSWHYGIFDSSLESTDEVALKSALKVGFEVGLPQEDLELARIKVQVMDKYKRDKTIGLIQDASAEGSAAMASKDGQKISKRV